MDLPLDFATLRLIWWGLLGVLLIAFAVTDGFDLGVGALLPSQGRISSYVGAGVNAMLFYSGKGKNGLVDLDDGFGYALQAGADVGIQGPWSLNVDVKKVWFETDAKINNGALTSSVNLDPWVGSLGVSRKF